jgi:hypothetical protein
MSYTPQTYTFSAATTNEAHSVTDITSVLSLLPDNTSKEITPRDVRDAIVSTWESSVIRYTSDGSTPYIGVDRNDVKDIKLFLGKKELSSSSIMSSMLLNSDSDIFVYNLKSDSATSQDTKMTFLAGTPSSNLFASGPYIKATYVSSPSMISLNLVNPATQGSINILSGFSASISINNLSWPSPSYISDVLSSPTTASSSSTSTLFLAVRAGSTLELVKYSPGGSTLGSAGSATTILGSPVTVNGFNLEYSNSSPTIATFGGIALGSTFSNVPLIQMIESMLYPDLPPAAIVVINTALNDNNTLERRHSPSGSAAITISYTVILTKKTSNITSVNLSLIRHLTGFSPSGGWPVLTLSGSGLVTSSFGPYSIGINGSQISSYTDKSVFTFSCNPSDGTLSSTYSTSFELVWPYFYGFSTTASGVAATIQSYALGSDISSGKMTKRIDTKGTQSVFFNGFGYQHFMYPSLYGTLSSILDGNDYTEYIHNSTSVWTYSIASVDSPSSYWNGRQYYVYRKTIESTSPVQLYKFNF